MLTVALVLGVVAAAYRQLPGDLAALTPLQAHVRAAGKACGLVALLLLFFQFFIAARLAFLDRVFALDRLLSWHRRLGAAAGVLAALHPMLLYALDTYNLGALQWYLWPELAGAASLTLLAAVICTSLWRAFLELSFEAWRRIHLLLAFPATVLAAVHGFRLGSDMAGGWFYWFWMVLSCAYGALFIWTQIIGPLLKKGDHFTVVAVKRENYNTWTIHLKPPGSKQFSYLPGQFVFLTPYGKNLPPQEHPFSLSSAPTPAAGGNITVTVKESGDYTKIIGRLSPGDQARVDGPYGHFSYCLFEREPLLFIAGGVGITPMISMLRNMDGTGDKRPVTLLWGNREKRDMFLSGELGALQEKLPGVKVHHVLSGPEEDGETHRITNGRKTSGLITGSRLTWLLLERLLSEQDRSARVFLCGPPPMMAGVFRTLCGLGFPRRRIHIERFSF